jgi:hypothetical protein
LFSTGNGTTRMVQGSQLDAEILLPILFSGGCFRETRFARPLLASEFRQRAEAGRWQSERKIRITRVHYCSSIDTYEPSEDDKVTVANMRLRHFQLPRTRELCRSGSESNSIPNRSMGHYYLPVYFEAAKMLIHTNAERILSATGNGRLLGRREQELAMRCSAMF